MPDPIDDIVSQARQGSVAAVIQVLNEKLAESGVRTRAVFTNGVLQLLCEAASPEQLEQSTLSAKIKQILEAIAPRNIRRVNINSRIVREQQLLWLEEISRDPENQLLWSEQITIKQASVFKRLAEDVKSYKPVHNKAALPKASRPVAEKRQFWRGIVGGASLSLLLLLVGWVLYDYWQNSLNPQPQGQSSPSPEPVATSPTPAISPPPASEPFAEAVRLAEQAAAAGKTAQSSVQWLEIATKWQQASELMAQVTPENDRYETAQDRVRLYRKNSEAAQNQAEKTR